MKVISLLPWLVAIAGLMLGAEEASAQHWEMVFGSSPQRLLLSPNLPPQIAALVPKAPTSGTIRFQLPASTIVDGRLIVRISNEAGSLPVRVAAASVVRVDEDGAVSGESTTRLTFGGRPGTILSTGAPAISDPVSLPVGGRGPIVVNLYVPDGIWLYMAGGAVMTVAPGDQTRSAKLANARSVLGRPLVTAIYAESAAPPKTIVALGDSITDGNRFANVAFRGWTDTLRSRLGSGSEAENLNLVNAGISGNRLLTEGMGESGLARLDRDVLSVPGVEYLVVALGINDIGHAGGSEFFALAPPLTSDELIEGYRQVIARSHVRGLKVILGTITPWEGSAVMTAPREALRVAVNNWIRTQRVADGVVDFERAVQDPARPAALRRSFDSGDHLHPNDAGYRAMGAAIDLKLFRSRSH